MASKAFTKDPDAVLDYAIDWSDWLGTGETLWTSAWSVPSGITNIRTEKTGTKTTIWLGDGTANRDYLITNRITTTASPSRTDDRTLLIRVRNR